MFKHLVCGILASCAISCFAQVVGPNVNMLTGANIGTGDPFLQRQNEPSIAISSRNPAHILAVANDYRLVDVPGLLDGSDEVGDVWLGLFRSLDSGQTWKSTVLPGCPYNIVPCKADLLSPINNRMAAADGTVRPGPNGMFVMNGIAFDRGKNALGNVFVSRFIDLNNKENGDPIVYLDTMVIDTGTSGQFLDKPWIATALVPGTTRTCTVGGVNGIPSQTFPAFDVYLVFSKFTGSSTSPSSQIMFTKSEDCGKTWSGNPVKLSESNSSNQGTSVGVNPLTGDVNVAWRRSASSSDTDAIMVTKWTRATNQWVQPAKVAVTLPANTFFDQPKITGSALAFRAKAFPTLAVDQLGRVYVAWAQRGLAPAPYASNSRILVAMSTNGIDFPANQQTVADSSPAGGHQLMPSLAFAGGRLMLVYYDNRDSQTYGKFTATGGGNYTETRVQVGTPGAAFTGPNNGQYIVDNRTLPRLHTIDVRGLQVNTLLSPPLFGASTRISQYKFGKLPPPDRTKFPDGGTPDVAVQLEYNPPNFPMYAKGSASFMGDYIEVAAPIYLPKTGGGWEYNLSNPEFAVFHATWADNRNVRPPKAPLTWLHYTPVASTGGLSLYDPNQQRPVCISGQEGMRNSDVYTARISGGLVVTTAGNYKPLNGSFSRAFSVIVQNQTRTLKTFRLDIANQPSPSGTASLLPPPAPSAALTLSLVVEVAARGSATRTVYVQSPNRNAPVKVNVVEVASVLNPSVVAGGLQSSTTLNPDIVNPDIVNPDIVNPDIVNPDIVVAESYNPDIVNPYIVNPDIVNPDIVNPDIVNPDIVNPDIVNPDIVNPDIVNPDIVNPDIVNPDIVNPDIVSSEIAAGYSDTIWNIKNIGNTSSSYLTKLYSRGGVNVCQPPQVSTTFLPCVKMQLFLNKRYKNLSAGVQSNGCKLSFQVQNQLVAAINTPVFTPLGNLPDTTTAASNPAVNNPTIALQPGEEAQLVLRTFGGFDPRSLITPVIVSQVPKGPLAKAPITLTITNGTLPDGRKGLSYSASIDTIGSVLAEAGARPTFNIVSGALPGGLNLLAHPTDLSKAVITGTVSAGLNSSTFNFTVRVEEDPPLDQFGVNLPLRFATQAFSIRVVDPLVQPPLSGTTLPAAALNTSYSANLTIGGGTTPLTFTLAPGSALPPGLSLSTSNANTALISGTPIQGGTFPFTIYVRDASCVSVPCAPQSITVSLSIVVDGSAPTVSANLSGTQGSNGWFTSDVGVTWTIGDPESGIKTTSAGCANTTLTATATLNCTATNNANMSTPFTQLVRIDQTAPVVSPTVTGTLGAGGWYTGNVTVSWAVSDPESGLQSNSCEPTTLSVDSAGTAVTCSATNLAGRSTSQTVTVKIDKSAPLISSTRTPAANANGWNNGDVTVTFACTDSGSGATSPAPVVVSAEGAGQSVTRTCTDAAGNTASATVSPINIDKTAPVAGATRAPAANVNGWNNGSVTVAFTCSDAISGAASPGSSVVVSSQAANQSRTGTCTDLAGNSSNASVNGISIDTFAPSITIAAPVNGSVYLLGSSFVASYSCFDALSTVGACAGPVTSGTSVTVSAVSATTFTVTASDLAGNTSSATATYNGQYVFSGFQSPLGPAGTFSGNRNLGSAVPLGYTLTDGNNQPISDLATTVDISSFFTGPRQGGNPCPVTASGTRFILYAPTIGATGGSTFRVSGGQYSFNWDSTTASATGPGCYTVSVQLNDGSSPKMTSIELR